MSPETSAFVLAPDMVFDSTLFFKTSYLTILVEFPILSNMDRSIVNGSDIFTIGTALVGLYNDDLSDYIERLLAI